MQVLERVDFFNNWLTIIFLFSLVLLAVLKMINQQKLSGYSKAFFTNGFIKESVLYRTSFFSAFNVVLFLFSVIIFSVFFTYIAAYFLEKELSFSVFLKVLVFVFGYFSVFILLDTALCRLFLIRPHLAYFVDAKIGYFYNTALFLFPVLIITTYSLLSIYVLIAVFMVFFILTITLAFLNNKNLILNKLFYFILYLCGLEIAPLLIIYKITV